MKFCKNCGRTVVDEASFCGFCGKNLATEDETAVVKDDAVALDMVVIETDDVQSEQVEHNEIKPIIQETTVINVDENISEETAAAIEAAVEEKAEAETAQSYSFDSSVPLVPFSKTTIVKEHTDKETLGKAPEAYSTYGFFWSMAIMYLPIIGFIFTIVWSFSEKVNINKRNFARANLIFAAISTISLIIGLSVTLFMLLNKSKFFY